MAISGTYGQFGYRVNQLIEDAALDAGIGSPLLTADLLYRAVRALNLMLGSMPNLRIYTWQQQQVLIPLYENQARVVAPTGTFNLLDRLFRTPTRLDGTLTSSAGGVLANSDDDDFETIFAQGAPLGALQSVFTSATQLYEVGILWAATQDVAYVIENSYDSGGTWNVLATQSVSVTDRSWTWIALDGAVPVTHWRIRMTAGTLAAREIYWGGAYTDIPIAQMTRTQYMQMTNKAQPGRPLQGWLDRQRDATYLWVWQVPQRLYRYCHVVAIQQKMLADVTSLRETLDVPPRYYEMIRSQLAVWICRRFPEADRKRLADLQAAATEAYIPAQNEDRDGAPITVYPNIRPYT